jgi:hypothetical protein
MNGCVRAINRTRGTSLCDKIEDAGSLSGRSRALLGRAALVETLFRPRPLRAFHVDAQVLHALRDQHRIPGSAGQGTPKSYAQAVASVGGHHSA